MKECTPTMYRVYLEVLILHRRSKRSADSFGERFLRRKNNSNFQREILVEAKELKVKSYSLYYELSILHDYAKRSADKMKKLPPEIEGGRYFQRN